MADSHTASLPDSAKQRPSCFAAWHRAFASTACVTCGRLRRRTISSRLADLPADTERVVEEHLLICDACGDRLREIIALAERLRVLAPAGSLQVVVDDEFLRHAVEAGLRVREYAPPPGGSIQCTVAADDDLLVARLATGVITAARVDLSWCDTRGVEHQRMVDIPIHKDAGVVICQQSTRWAKASPSATMIARLLAVNRLRRSAAWRCRH